MDTTSLINKRFLSLQHSLNHDLSNPEYPLRALKEVTHFFNGDFGYITGLQDGHMDLLHTRGDISVYAGYPVVEDTDPNKPQNSPLPEITLPFHMTNQIIRSNRDNPFFDYLYQYNPKMTIFGARHPAELGVGLVRYDQGDYSEEEQVVQDIIMPMLANNYYEHKLLLQHQDLHTYLMQLMKQFDALSLPSYYALIDEKNNIVLKNSMEKALSKYNISFDALLPKVVQMYQKSQKDQAGTVSFYAPSSVLRTREFGLYWKPVYIEKRLYLLLELIIYDDYNLTAQEKNVLSLVKEGYDNAMIAEQLDISTETVKKHLSHMFRKTGTSNRTQLALKVT